MWDIQYVQRACCGLNRVGLLPLVINNYSTLAACRTQKQLHDFHSSKHTRLFHVLFSEPRRVFPPAMLQVKNWILLYFFLSFLLQSASCHDTVSHFADERQVAAYPGSRDPSETRLASFLWILTCTDKFSSSSQVSKFAVMFCCCQRWIPIALIPPCCVVQDFVICEAMGESSTCLNLKLDDKN